MKNGVDESYIAGNPIITYETSKKILEQMPKYICKIKTENEKDNEKQGTGFFCKIPFPDNNNLLPVLITNNHIINEKLLYTPDIKITIDIKEERDIKVISLNNRKRYTEKEKYDITIIELKETDNIKSYLELNDIIINNIFNEEKRYKDLKDEAIYVMQFPEGKLSISYGILADFYEDRRYNFQHTSSTKYGSSGSPILTLNDKKVIGIHKIGNNNNKYNIGTLLDYPIRDFIKLNFISGSTTNVINTMESVEDPTNIISSKESNKSLNIIKKENEIIINLNSNKENKDTKKIISKEIICPECKENILINIYDFKINLYECKNYHIFNNILMNNFYESQKIDLNEIECNECKEIIQNYSICNTCNINLCSSCKSIHNKSHVIINYEDKNYICRKHNKSFIKYCKKCNENLCIICENEHKNHNIFDFKKILINKNKLIKKLEELKSLIDKYKIKVHIIKEILDKTTNMIDIYYKINEDYINNYNINKRNYHKLHNLYNLNNNNDILIDDLGPIINDDKLFPIFEFSFNKFYNENGEKYFGELRNNLKEGKGLFYYNTNDEKGRKKYVGEFKNDKMEGKGIMYLKNGNRFEGEYKNDKREGKGIYYYNNGDKYDGYFKNDAAEGKGTYIWSDGDKYEGDWINDKREGKGKYFWKNGDIYEGDWKNDKREGRGNKHYANFGEYDGEWKDEKKEGTGIMTYINGNKYVGEWKNGKREGNGIVYYKNGTFEKGIWKNDKCIEIIYFN